jgi:Bifunctional DNA primase/polymerase, N-terminal
LLDDAIGLSHPDCHPPERQDLALCTTQKLLALKPFVFPAPQPKKPIPRDGSITPRAAGAEKTLRTLYPCAECASTIPYFYCTQCKTEWEKRREAERAKLREQRRKQYANRKRRRRAWRERLCEICGTKLEDSRRADIRFCSSACRQKGHRARVTNSRGRYRVTTMRRNAALDAISKVAIPKGTFVVDLDGEQAGRDFVNMCGRHGEPPPTLTVITGRGKHLYFRSSAEVKNSAGRIGPGIDTRGPGGYTIAPPSVHPSGSVYLLDRRCLEVADAPQWIVDLARPKVEVQPVRQPCHHPDASLRGLKGIIGTVANARQGERNSLVFWGACRAAELVGAGIIAEQFAEQLLIEAAASAGLPWPEARVTVRSGFRQWARHG